MNLQRLHGLASGPPPRNIYGWALALTLLLGHAAPGHATVPKSAQAVRSRQRAAGQHHLGRLDPAQILGDRIVAFALSQQGRQVGDGECFALADRALSQAGAKTASAYAEITPDADYVWGTPVPLAKIRPGDILQFRDFRIRRLITKTLSGVDGATASSQGEEFEERDHHTAVVERSLGGSVAILEQNVGPLGRIVQRRQIELFPAVLRQADPAESSQVTIQISVEGAVQAYRPQAAAVAMVARMSTVAGLGAMKAAATQVRRDF